MKLLIAMVFTASPVAPQVASLPAVSLVPVSPIPEPETYAMMLVGLGMGVWAVKRRKK